MAEKYISFSLDDERTKNIAEVISNPTSKKIINFLADKAEASESDIAGNLGLPINTVEYNLRKLESSGLIEKSKNFFWSAKGKKIAMYKISNKKIIIQPRGVGLSSAIKGIISILFSGAIVSLLLRHFVKEKTVVVLQKTAEKTVESVASGAGSLAGARPEIIPLINQTNSVAIPIISTFPSWAWFFLGVIFAVLVYILIQIFERRKR